MRATNITLRQAQSTDARHLHELHTAAVRTLCAQHYPAEILDGWLLNRTPDGYLVPIDRGAIFVAQSDSTVLGFGEAAPGVVVAIYVHPSMTRQGIGTRLLRHALERARQANSGPVTVESTLNATAFYARSGFREIRRSTLKRNHVEVPVVVMEHNAV